MLLAVEGVGLVEGDGVAAERELFRRLQLMDIS